MSDEQKPHGGNNAGSAVAQPSAGPPINGVKPQSAKPVNGALSAEPKPAPSAEPNNGKINGHAGINGSHGRMEPSGAPLPQTQGGRLTGTCKNWSKGYGFISRDDGQGDVFVHQTQIRKAGFRSLQIGEKVEFDIETKEDGRKQAVNVTGPNGADVIGQERPPQNRGGGFGGGRGGYNRGSRNGGYPSRGGYNTGGFQASPYGSQPNFGQGYSPFIQQPYAYGQATTGFGQAAPYPQPGQPPAQAAQFAQPVAGRYAPTSAQYGSAAPAQYGQPYGAQRAMAGYPQTSAPQGDPAKATSPRSSYGQQSGYGQAAPYQQGVASATMPRE